MMRAVTVAALLLVGCSGDGSKDTDPTQPTHPPDPTTVPSDGDGDGYDEDAGDCDDNNVTIYPGAPDEPYDGIDSDCAGDSDFDVDRDGHDSDLYGGGDCDDNDPDVNPDATDAPYDGVDADCDGASDNDADLDGYDDAGHGGDDCDDTDPAIHPDAYEDCDTIDNDCDQQIDELAPTWYSDNDRDGYGEIGAGTQACNQPPDTSDVTGDCNDLDDTVYPGAPGVACDGQDNDCDPLTFEAGGALLDGVAAADLPTAVANATTGSVVEVCEGLHTVHDLAISTGMQLVGLAGSANTVLDAGGTSGILQVTTTQPVAVTGFTLRNGSATEGGALRLGAGADVVLTDVIVRDNTAGDGAGIWGDDNVQLHLVDSEVRDNVGNSTVTPVPRGGGIQLGDNATLTLEDSIVTGNDAGSCAGIDLGLAATVTGIGTAEITDNTTSLGAAGGCLGDGSYASGLYVGLNNSSNATGGLDFGGGTLVDVQIVANEATLTGGGLTIYGASVLDGVTIENNLGFDGGGLVAVFPGTRVVMDGCTVRNNDATVGFADGGGARLEQQAELESINTTWIGNMPTDISLNTSGTTFAYGGADFVCSDATGVCQ